METIDCPCINIEQNGISYYLGKLPGKIIANITYVARRGESDEDGAVQRSLSKKRIVGIKDFLLRGGFFPNNIILNFVQNDMVDIHDGALSFKNESRIAQIIDGQHRVEGLKMAIIENERIGDIEFPVLMTIKLHMSQCAELFLSINTEQKPVPKSLIYDLYDLRDVPNKDFNIERGADIAKGLNEEGPFKGYIKFPGGRHSQGGIQLSAFINILKPLIKRDGEFSKYTISELETQKRVLENYFSAIADYYGKEWNTTKNPFLFAAGFGAAIDVLILRLLPYCNTKNRTFTKEIFKSILVFDRSNLILKNSADRNLSGDAARATFKERLEQIVNIEIPNEEDIKL